MGIAALPLHPSYEFATTHLTYENAGQVPQCRSL